MYKSILGLVVLQVVISAQCLATSPADSSWIKTANGCKIYNPNPVSSETITWSGDCCEGFACGEGVLVWYRRGVEGSRFNGTLVRGVPQGFGQYIYEDGDNYLGHFKNGDYNGEGTYTYIRKDHIVFIEKGVFKDDELIGPGTTYYFDAVGDTSIIEHGFFKDQELTHKGWKKVFYENATSYYSGEFREGEYHGRGVHVYQGPIGTTRYEGEFDSDLYHGIGTLKWHDQKYVGNFSKGTESGQGRLYFKDSLIYSGDWQDEQFHGVGKRIYPDKSVFVGNFKNGKRHGFGILKWANGDQYIGEFEDDLFHGQGYTSSKFSNLEGNWQFGKLSLKRVVKEKVNRKYGSELLRLMPMFKKD